MSAHEVGHTLGLGHNYYDSSTGRISVMDYPHPLSTIREDGTLDLSQAYTAQIGSWDKVAINYGYREFPSGTNEKTALTRILDDAWTADLKYFTNQDTDIHPRVEQWSNGVNQEAELSRLMRVRRIALNNLGENTIRPGVPTALIEEPLVPIYMYHRYAVEGASSMIAGQDFVYAMRGDGRTPTSWVSGEAQRKTIDVLSATLRPSELTIPKKILDLITPRPASACTANCSPARPARVSIRSTRPRLPPMSPSASCCSPIARHAWWRSTPWIRPCPASAK